MTARSIGGRRWQPVAVAALAATVVAGLGASATDIGPWYQALHKPSWQPPDWLFGPVWTLIYSLIAVAGVKAWNAARSRRHGLNIVGVFALNALLNIAWSELFFNFHRPDWALYEVVAFWLSIVVLIVTAASATPVAGWAIGPISGLGHLRGRAEPCRGAPQCAVLVTLPGADAPKTTTGADAPKTTAPCA